jgi:alpha-tubulin suppressor-like RCC1 family protein
MSLFEPAIAIASGGYHACALTQSKLLFCWGANSENQLRRNDAAVFDAPVEVAIGEVEEVALGTWHSCARFASGDVMCWGQNWLGRLGNGLELPLDGIVRGPPPSIRLMAARDHSCSIGTGGSLHCWGRNAFGQVNRRPATALEPVDLLWPEN